MWVGRAHDIDRGKFTCDSGTKTSAVNMIHSSCTCASTSKSSLNSEAIRLSGSDCCRLPRLKLLIVHQISEDLCKLLAVLLVSPPSPSRITGQSVTVPKESKQTGFDYCIKEAVVSPHKIL